jgi:tyramine---L-glutamate ligase
LKILLLEYITGGGLRDAPLPPSLLREGQLMRDAILHDFASLNQFNIVTTYDARLPAPMYAKTAVSIEHEPLPEWQVLMQKCDAALIIAPETGEILLKLTQMLESTSARNLGSNSATVAVTTSKLQTHAVLHQAGILNVPTYTAAEFTERYTHEDFLHGYVVKPDDGAGCEQTWFFETYSQLTIWLEQHSTTLHHHIIQPFLPGIAASMSILCNQGRTWLLACNRQYIYKALSYGQSSAFQYRGSEVNGLTQYREQFLTLSHNIAQAIPGLNGYIGIDVIIHNDQFYVVDINPRITTSYIGLTASLGCNPAQLLMSAVSNADFELPETLQAQPVEVNVYA